MCCCLAVEHHESGALTSLHAWRYWLVQPREGWRLSMFPETPKFSIEELRLEGPGALMSQKDLLPHPGSCAYLTGLQLRKKKWLLWKGPNSKSLPVCRGNWLFFCSSRGGTLADKPESEGNQHRSHHLHNSPDLADGSGNQASRPGGWPGW